MREWVNGIGLEFEKVDLSCDQNVEWVFGLLELALWSIGLLLIATVKDHIEYKVINRLKYS